jgi:ribokinase
MGTIVVVGSSNADLVIKAPRLPKPGETVTGGAFFRARGGKGANQAVAAARAGGQVVLIAALGLDALGDDAIEGFEAEGIDTAHVRRTADLPSGVALIMVDAAGQNAIAVAEGANGLLTARDVRACEPVIAAADVLVVQLEIPLEAVSEAVGIAHQHGRQVILNPAPACRLPDELLSRISVLTPNASETELLTGIAPNDQQSLGRAADALLARGIGAAAITLGASGVFLATADRRKWIDAWPVVPEDTTGAGDVFTAALAVALADAAPLLEAVRFANAAAALSVTRRGAQPSAPRRQEITDLLDRRGSA